jgi:hypothetical protein
VEVIGVIDADYVRSRLQYDPETGVFIWKPKAAANKIWNMRYAGEIAGTINNQGYRRISIGREGYMAGRLAWLIVHGEWPENEIDHINRKRDDDRLVNLRDVTHTDNQNNRSNNNGLPEGVHWSTGSAKYIAKITKGVPVFGMTYLGQYGDPIIAGDVVQEGIGIICDNEDEETIKRLLKELKDACTEILSEAERRKSGLPKGVKKNGNRFAAQIRRNGKMAYLGTFGTPEEAAEAYLLTKG